MSSSAHPPGIISRRSLKKRRRLGLILMIFAILLLLLCVGTSFIMITTITNSSFNAANIANTTVTPVAPPSGKPVVSSAASILSNPRTSTSVDVNLHPSHVTTVFVTGQRVYLTFDIHSGSQDGYIQAKWYADGQIVDMKLLRHEHGNTVGIVSYPYSIVTNNGVVELYWCTQADCSDAQLAQVAHFTVIPNGLSL